MLRNLNHKRGWRSRSFSFQSWWQVFPFGWPGNPLRAHGLLGGCNNIWYSHFPSGNLWHQPYIGRRYVVNAEQFSVCTGSACSMRKCPNCLSSLCPLLCRNGLIQSGSPIQTSWQVIFPGRIVTLTRPQSGGPDDIVCAAFMRRRSPLPFSICNFSLKKHSKLKVGIRFGSKTVDVGSAGVLQVLCSPVATNPHFHFGTFTTFWLLSTTLANNFLLYLDNIRVLFLHSSWFAVVSDEIRA